MLAACYRSSLALAAEHGLRSIAFPAISTGAYRYPPDRAAPVVSETIESVLSAGSPLEHVRLIFFNEADARIFLKHQTFTITGQP
jgi:O-acetyl-ADP-ribose deacetylase (regulator of RNase III)